ncbi:hypothetical protein N9L68_06975, partial [bacterium]|nr:hypothetical protein [bacterium]
MKMAMEDTGVAKDDILMVVDLYPNGLAEWAHGVFELQKATTATDLPAVCYLGITETAESTVAMKKDLQELVMTNWWPNHPQSEPADVDYDPLEKVKKPILKLASWPEGRRPLLPYHVKSTFHDSSPIKDPWDVACASFEHVVGQRMVDIGLPTMAPARVFPSNSSAPSFAGPDYQVEHKPHEPKPVELKTVPDDAFPMRTFSTRSKRRGRCPISSYLN